MALGWIFGILIFAAAVCAFAFGGFKFYKAEWDYSGEEEKKARKSGFRLIALGIVAVLLFITIPFSFHTVDTGEVAVVKELGKAKEVKTSGTYFDFWMTNKYQKYDGKVQDIAIETAAYSSDAQTMTIKMTLQYKVLTDKVMDIAAQYGTLDALTTRITAIATEKTKSALSVHKAMDIIANRQDMSPAVETAIREAIGDEYYVNVVAVVLTDIEFSEAFETAVEDKMVAEQKQLKAEYDAAAKVTAAKAEAEANQLLEKSLTDKILQEMYIDKWDGKLPEVVAGENGISMILPSDSE